jgi:hypothetical protein
VPTDGRHHDAPDTCAICDHSIAGAPLTDAETGRAFHPQCVVERLPQDAAVRLLGLLALVALPTVVVWAA